MKFCWHTDQIRCDNCKPQRIERGCASESCFCTGECRMTEEEIAAKRKRDADFVQIQRDYWANKNRHR
jgi:hypothetical protein